MLAALAVLPCADVHAEDSSTGDRVAQAAPVVVGGGLYLVLELPLKDAVSPTTCRWCRPNAFDLGIRNALVWSPANVRTANTLSNVTGYLGAPLFATGMLIGTTADDPSGERWFDDAIPVLQAGIATGLINQVVKIVVARRRPYAELGGVRIRPENDVNTSFFSGHTSLGFSMVAAAGTVAHLRGYKSEAAIWIGGSVLALATGYFRIAADAHYATDVIAGALIGSAIGVAVPLLFHKDVLEDTNTPSATPRTASTAAPVMFSVGGAF